MNLPTSSLLLACGRLALLLMPLQALGAPAPAPSAAIFQLEPEFGVEPGVAKLLTDSLTQVLRTSGAFSRVVSSREIEALVGLERQKQLMACPSDGCVAELAGALGVDFLVVGNIGKLGASFLINIKLLVVRTGAVASSVANRIKGENEEALLDGLHPAALQLLDGAGLKHALRGGTAAPRTEVETPAAPAEAGAPAPWKKPLIGTGVAIACVGGVALVVALLATVAAGLSSLIPYFVAVETGPLNGEPRANVLSYGPPALAVALGVVAALALGVAGAGAVTSAVGLLVGN